MIRINFCSDCTVIGKHVRFIFDKKPPTDIVCIDVKEIGDCCTFYNTYRLDFPYGKIPEGTVLHGDVNNPRKIIRVVEPFVGTAIAFGDCRNLKNWMFEGSSVTEDQRIPFLEAVALFKKQLPSFYERWFTLGTNERMFYRKQKQQLKNLIAILKNS